MLVMQLTTATIDYKDNRGNHLLHLIHPISSMPERNCKCQFYFYSKF
jgi:hypothetical protein